MNRPPSANDVSALLGKQLLDAGKLTEHDVVRIVAAQRHGELRFGETAVALGLLNDRDLQQALALQYDYPYPTDVDSVFSPLLITAHEPFSAASEALRTLRSHLTLTWFNDARKCIVVSSARAREGASATAANLAIVYAQAGERTLLIDANFRRPRQHLLFGLKPVAGLSSLLNGRCSANESLMAVPPFRNLSVICAGAVPPNPQELLSRVTFSYLIETAPAAFDIVIVDTPPILEFADAQIVSARVGGCLLVTRRHEAKISDLREVKSVMAMSGGHMIGAVITD
jgi:protein-tyrosine kinase